MPIAVAYILGLAPFAFLAGRLVYMASGSASSEPRDC